MTQFCTGGLVGKVGGGSSRALDGDGGRQSGKEGEVEWQGQAD